MGQRLREPGIERGLLRVSPWPQHAAREPLRGLVADFGSGRDIVHGVLRVFGFSPSRMSTSTRMPWAR